MLKTIIFDFDGIIADTEPIHLEAFKIVLKDFSIELTDEDYFNKYLAYDDKTLFDKILLESGKDNSPVVINNLIDKKHIIIKSLIESNVVLFPGFTDFIKLIQNRYLICIASGALLAEIELILNKFRLLNFFHSITSADEVINCKPDPEPFIKALGKINKNRENMIKPSECLVIEDSIHGVDAAVAAGMSCVGITNSYNHEMLKDANVVVDSFNELNIDIIENIFIAD